MSNAYPFIPKTTNAYAQVEGWQKMVFGHTDEWYATEARKAWQSQTVRRPGTFATVYGLPPRATT